MVYIRVGACIRTHSNILAIREPVFNFCEDIHGISLAFIPNPSPKKDIRVVAGATFKFDNPNKPDASLFSHGRG